MDKKYCRLCHSPITGENELSSESGLCKPCVESNATEYDTLRLSTPGPLRFLLGLPDEHTEAEKKHCRCCGILFTPAESEDGDFCNSCAENIAKKYYFNTPADLSDETDTEPDSDSSEADSEFQFTETDSNFPEANIFTEADIKYCRRCGASITPEYRMYGIDDFCKSCIGSKQVPETDRKYCQRCGKIMTAENNMYGTNPDGSKNEEFCQACVGRPLDENYPDVLQAIGIIGITLGILLLTLLLLYPLRLIINEHILSPVSYIFSYTLAFVVIYLKRKRKTGKKTFDLAIKNKRTIPLSIISIYSLSISVIAMFAYFVPVLKPPDGMYLELAKQPVFLLFLHMVIFAPIFEELIFRGIILDGFLKNYSPLKAILISSLMFGLLHLHPLKIIKCFFSGIFYGWTYYKTKSVGLPIILHASINFIPFLVLAFVDSEFCKASSTSGSPPEPFSFLIVGLISLCIFLTSAYFFIREVNKSAAAPGVFIARA